MPPNKGTKRARAASPPLSTDSPPKKRATRTNNVKSYAEADDDVDPAATAGADDAPTKKARGRPKKVKSEPEPDVDDELKVATKTSKSKSKKDTNTDLGQDEDVKVNDAQTAHNKARLNVPVDEGCSLSGRRVYIDPNDGMIWDASLNQANASNNNNKFYRIQVLEGVNSGAFHTWTRWGRVGNNGQTKLLGNGDLSDAKVQFDKKFKEKSGLSWNDRGRDPISGKYVFVERSYEVEDGDEKLLAKGGAKRRAKSPPKCSLQLAVRSLMELIFNQEYIDAAMENFHYDAAKLPLGKLSKATITRGFQALKDLSALIDIPTSAPADMEELSNRYYSYIPHVFGMRNPPVIRTQEMLKREVELLESLSDLKDADNIIKTEDDDAEEVHPLDFRFKSLGMSEMTPVATGSDEFNEISSYLLKTCGQTHHFNYNIEGIFRIEREGELDRFQKSPYAQISSDRRLLWHGSRTTNYGGILSQGLRIAPPEAPVSGYMFGKGVYLADMSSKSANYCYSHVSGGYGLLLLCEAELGDPMQVLQRHAYNAGEDAKQKGVYSTWGQGTTGPKGWKDAKCVHPSLEGVKMPDVTQDLGDTGIPGLVLQYNEYICYDVAQIRLRYLLRINMGRGY